MSASRNGSGHPTADAETTRKSIIGSFEQLRKTHGMLLPAGAGVVIARPGSNALWAGLPLWRRWRLRLRATLEGARLLGEFQRVRPILSDHDFFKPYLEGFDLLSATSPPTVPAPFGSPTWFLRCQGCGWFIAADPGRVGSDRMRRTLEAMALLVARHRLLHLEVSR